LGSYLGELREARGDEVVVPRHRDYDLTRYDETERLFSDARPELVFHLAAEVGGIGANRANPGRYWYANLMMGAHVLELSRLHDVRKLVVAGTVCAYPKFTPLPFSEDELWNGYPEETNAPYGVAKKSVLVGAQAYREQYGTNDVFLLPANLYGPRDNSDLDTSHVIPALIRKMLDPASDVVLGGNGSPTGKCGRSRGIANTRAFRPSSARGRGGRARRCREDRPRPGQERAYAARRARAGAGRGWRDGRAGGATRRTAARPRRGGRLRRPA